MNPSVESIQIPIQEEEEETKISETEEEKKEILNFLPSINMQINPFSKSKKGVIILPMNFTGFSALQLDKNLDKDWLIRCILKKSSSTSRNEALLAWLKETSLVEKNQILRKILFDNLPVKELTMWFALFEIGKPILTQSLDIHGALAYYAYKYLHQRNNSINETLKKLNDQIKESSEFVFEALKKECIVTWSSPPDEIMLFFQGLSTKRILHQDGCFLTEDCLLTAENFSRASTSGGILMINMMLQKIEYPLLMIGSSDLFRSFSIKERLKKSWLEKRHTQIVRIIRGGSMESIKGVSDIIITNHSESLKNVLKKLAMQEITS